LAKITEAKWTQKVALARLVKTHATGSNTKAESAFRANVINIERGCDVDTAGTSRTVEEQAAENSWEIPQIRMRQTQEKCWEVILTEEEREFIE